MKIPFVLILLISSLIVHAQNFDLLLNPSLEKWNLNTSPYSKEDIILSLSKLPLNVKEALINERTALVLSNKKLLKESYDIYNTTGNRSNYDEINNVQLNTLKSIILLELINNNGDYIPAIKEICEGFLNRDYWIMPAHLNKLDVSNVETKKYPTYVDIGASDIAELLAWSVFLFDKELGILSEEIVRNIKYKALVPFVSNQMHWMKLDKNDKLNNWTPWINYKLLLVTTLIKNNLDQDIADKVLYKSLDLTKLFLETYSEDGYCDEGPVYWQHSIVNVCKYLDIVKNIDSSIDLSKNLKLKNAVEFISKMYISGDYYINYGDSPSRTFFISSDIYKVSDYLKNPKLKNFSIFLANRGKFLNNPFRGTLTQAINGVLVYDQFVLLKNPIQDFEKGFYYQNGQVVIGRTYDNNKGFIFSAKGGNNSENHNHNDVGNFILYYQGLPLIIDLGKESYTQMSFSNRRYSIHSMGSYFHNVPRINGVNQHNGPNFKANDLKFDISATSLNFSLDISSAYPINSRVAKWKRSFSLSYIRPELIVGDDYLMKEDGSKNSLVLICYNKPEIKSDIVYLKNSKGSKVSLRFDKDIFNLIVEDLQIKDSEMISAWGQSKFYKIELVYKNRQKKGGSNLIFSGL